MVGLLALFSLVFMGIALVMNTYAGSRSRSIRRQAGGGRSGEWRRSGDGSPCERRSPARVQRLSQAWQGDAIGYAFLLDRDQRFLAFPRPELVTALTAGEVADRHPGFRRWRTVSAGAAAAEGRRRRRDAGRVYIPSDLLDGRPSLPSFFPVPGTDWSWSRSRPRVS